MAHSPEKKAAVIIDLAGGMSISEAARIHQVDRKTLRGWYNEIPQGASSKLDSHEELSPQDRRRVQFIEALENSLIETVASVGKLLRVVTDPEFMERHPEHIQPIFDTAHERAHGIVGIAERLQSIQSNQRQLSAVAEGELSERSNGSTSPKTS